MSRDSKSRKDQDALDALSALGGGDAAPAEPPAKKPEAKPPASEPQDVEIPEVPAKRPSKPAENSTGRPATPPPVRKAPKATPAPSVARSARPAPAKAAPARRAPAKAAPAKATSAKAAPARASQRSRRPQRSDVAKIRRRIASLKQSEGYRQTAFPILLTIGLLLVVLGIIGLVMMPAKTLDPNQDTDNWDVDPHSRFNSKGFRYMVYATFPIGAVIMLGGVVLIVQAQRLQQLCLAEEQALEEQEAA